jgi:hypothetical protein
MARKTIKFAMAPVMLTFCYVYFVGCIRKADKKDKHNKEVGAVGSLTFPSVRLLHEIVV